MYSLSGEDVSGSTLSVGMHECVGANKLVVRPKTGDKSFMGKGELGTGKMNSGARVPTSPAKMLPSVNGKWPCKTGWHYLLLKHADVFLMLLAVPLILEAYVKCSLHLGFQFLTFSLDLLFELVQPSLASLVCLQRARETVFSIMSRETYGNGGTMFKRGMVARWQAFARGRGQGVIAKISKSIEQDEGIGGLTLSIGVP
ncbi:hypothetical protein OBBRIDRAFT_806681 [Obba rivulosa]|uniref:Uncharacterized protein n=1 Tax=Obba rivulosa TaxID=1052685 RepID=A0A8E2ARE6_9APHY|nr:hypothetical protein OBBRIDRAFT_806681 [Obba rivulosa]